ncbi:MAG TPA: KH domain-containing protein [Candidatus Dadabacteria bacterium]|nr:KH domain-containing protein [Candidatus Dadabacteria bacterium]
MSIEREFEGKTVTDATIEACKELGITRDELNFEVIREGSSGVLGIGSRNAIIKVRDVESGNNDIQKNELDAVPMDTEKIEKIFRHIVDHFVEESEIEVEVQNRNILLKMKSSADLGFLIGKKGDMIKNLEFLLSRIASKQQSQSVLVGIDINSYRERKNDQLKEKVQSMVEKVVSINRPLSLNPMNSYERRISYLIIEQNNEVTYTTKEYGHLKKITIFPKKLDTNLS